MRARKFRSPGALLPVLLTLPLACGGGREDATGDLDGSRTAPPPASGLRAAGTLGTIRATIDGQERTWYVVSGTVHGESQATGGWMEPSRGTRGIALAGFDQEQVALGSFQWNEQGILAGYGDYAGSLLTLIMHVEGEPSAFEVRFPPAPGQAHAVSFMPRATATDLSQIHFLTDGELRVSHLAFPGGAARVEGTFSGTFRTMDGQRGVEITNGRFEAAGLARWRAGSGG